MLHPRLARSQNKWISGVCGGIAEWVGWDPLLVRLLFVAITVSTKFIGGIIVYLVLWLAMPKNQTY